jgi:phosphotransferase system HPr-like phosphotransfer protein
MNKIKISLNGEFDKIKEFVRLANTYAEDVNVYRYSSPVDGKSIDDLMKLDLSKDISVELLSNNETSLNKFSVDMRQFV